MPVFSRLQEGGVLDLLRGALGSASDDDGIGADVGIGNVQVGFMPHHGHAVRGVVARTAIQPGGLIMRIPEKFHMTEEDVTVPLRLRAVNDTSVKTGLWLAEQRVHPKSKFWSTFIGELPTLEEYRKEGMPLATSDADLARLSRLPEFGSMAKWIQKIRAKVRPDLLRYRTALHLEKQTCAMPGTDEWLPETPVSYEDALWGTIVSITRDFARHATPAIDYIMPGADLINHQSNVNAAFEFEEPSGDFVVRALQKIKPGEEIMHNYDPRADPADIWMRFGIPPVRTRFDPHTCKELCGADFGQGPFPQSAKALVDRRCKCNVARPVDSKPSVAVVQPENQALFGKPQHLHGSVAAARFL